MFRFKNNGSKWMSPDVEKPDTLTAGEFRWRLQQIEKQSELAIGSDIAMISMEKERKSGRQIS